MQTIVTSSINGSGTSPIFSDLSSGSMATQAAWFAELNLLTGNPSGNDGSAGWKWLN